MSVGESEVVLFSFSRIWHFEYWGNKAVVNINTVGSDFDSEEEKVVNTTKIIVSQVSIRTLGNGSVPNVNSLVPLFLASPNLLSEAT